MRALGDYLQVKCHACVGGTSVREDTRVLQGESFALFVVVSLFFLCFFLRALSLFPVAVRGKKKREEEEEAARKKKNLSHLVEIYPKTSKKNS